MGRAIAFLLLLFLLGMGYVIIKGMRQVSKKERPDPVEQVEQDRESSGPADPVETTEEEDLQPDTTTRVARKAEDLAEKAKTSAKEVGKKIKKEAEEAVIETKKVVFGEFKLKVEPFPLEMKAGEKATLKVTRSARDYPPMQLKLTPGPNANLKATGGKFEKDGKTTTITIETTAGKPRMVQLTIQAGEVRKNVPVVVKGSSEP